MSRRPDRPLRRPSVDIRITLAPRGGLPILDAMDERATCACCELEIQGPEAWIRSGGRRYHAACFRSALEYRRLTESPTPPKPRAASS